MKRIKITRGRYTIVDDEDYEKLKQFSWNCTTHGYVSRWDATKDTQVYMHREILNPPNGMVVDHINGNRLDNRRDNIRIVPQRVNAANRITPHGRIPYVGVYDSTPKHRRWKLKKPYATKLHVNGKSVWIGRFETPEQAREAYLRAKQRLLKEKP